MSVELVDFPFVILCVGYYLKLRFVCLRVDAFVFDCCGCLLFVAFGGDGVLFVVMVFVLFWFCGLLVWVVCFSCLLDCLT